MFTSQFHLSVFQKDSVHVFYALWSNSRIRAIRALGFTDVHTTVFKPPTNLYFQLLRIAVTSSNIMLIIKGISRIKMQGLISKRNPDCFIVSKITKVGTLRDLGTLQL